MLTLKIPKPESCADCRLRTMTYTYTIKHFCLPAQRAMNLNFLPKNGRPEWCPISTGKKK